MARVVLTHGINHRSDIPLHHREKLLHKWSAPIYDAMPNLQAGDVSLAFYAHHYSTPGAMGNNLPHHLPHSEHDDELLHAFINTLSDVAALSDDKMEADRVEAIQARLEGSPNAQGIRADFNRMLGSVADTKFCATHGIKTAKHVYHALRDVTQYQHEPDTKEKIQDTLLDALDDSTEVLIAHSLGSVVAYETLHSHNRPIHLITVGSPLACKQQIQQHLKPGTREVPRCVASWHNFYDKLDPVSSLGGLRTHFRTAEHNTEFIQDHEVRNGLYAHSCVDYLAQESLLGILQDIL